MKKFCTENNITQKFCPVRDHRGCGLVERTIQTIKRRLGVMLLDEKVQSIKLCFSTIIRDLRWNKQKSIKVSPFEAHFGRLPKTEFKIVRDKFLMDSDRLDKEHLERSALTASQLKRRIDQSRENVKIIRKGRNSRDTSPLFRHDTAMTKDRARAKELKQLLEANARWNATRRDLSDSELRRVVDETSTINPELRKELLYSWERGFIEDKQTTSKEDLSGSFLRKHEQRKSGKALTIPLKSKIVSETPSTIKTAAGAVYRKSDIARSKLSTQPKAYSSEKKRSPTGEEPRSKQQKTGTLPVEEDSDSAEEHDAKDRGLRDENLEDSQLKEKFQNSPSVVTSRDTRTGGGLNLGGKRGKPNRAGPVVQNTKTTRGKTQESGTTKAAKAVTKKRDTSNEAVYIELSAPKEAPTTKKITQQTSEKEILDTFQNNNMTSQQWEEITNQGLTRGVQKEVEKLLSQQMDPVDYSTPGFADESDKEEDTTTVRRSNRQTKNQGPKRYGSPVSHSIKLIGCEDDVTELNLAVLEAYRLRLAKLNINNKETSENNTFDRLERHLFKKKFGATSLDEAGSWNAARNKEEVLKKITKD